MSDPLGKKKKYNNNNKKKKERERPQSKQFGPAGNVGGQYGGFSV